MHRSILKGLGFLFAIGCLIVNPTRADSQRLVLTGSSTVAPLALEIAKRFEKRNPGVRVDVQSGGSSRGVADARSGMADIGMVSRALKPQETDLTAYTIARDGIAIIVNRANPISALTDDQIKAIIIRGALPAGIRPRTAIIPSPWSIRRKAAQHWSCS